MKKLSILAAFGFAFCTAASAQTASDLLNDGKNTDNITTYGMGYSQHRYSPLTQINTKNIRRLVPVWSYSTENNYGEQAQPLIYNGVMYVTNAKWTAAIDVESGRQIWRTAEDWDADSLRVVCCGVSNKGAAIYNGKIYRVTIDAHVRAMDLKTGKTLWKQKFAEWKEGISGIAAPMIANGVLISGMSGAEFGV